MTSIPCVRFKEGVRLDPVTPTLVRILCALDMNARMQAYDLTVTCGREAHGIGDPHTDGRAVDVRVGNMTPAQILASMNYLTRSLGPEFTVLLESPHALVNEALQSVATINPGASAPHFHIQSRKFTIYPPQDAQPLGVKA